MIAVNPRGHLRWDANGCQDVWPDTAAVDRVEKAFARGGSCGLLHLASRELNTSLPASVAHWRELGRLYLSSFCHQMTPATAGVPSVPPPEGDLRSVSIIVPKED